MKEHLHAGNFSSQLAGLFYVVVLLVVADAASLAQAPLLTHRNDNSRTGQNLSETYLTPSVVNSTHFGQLFVQPLDGMAVAEPLYVPNLQINGTVHNVCTTVYMRSMPITTWAAMLRHCGTPGHVFVRVSTQKQGRSGLGLEAQQVSIAEYVRSVRGALYAYFTEVESGKRKDRPQLAAALAQCRLQGATLIVAKLDRLARNVAFVSNLMESGCEFCAVDFPQANRFMIHLLAAVGEYEAKLISDRTKAALQTARRRGVRLGGDRGNILDIQQNGSRIGNATRTAKALQRANDLRPVIAEIQANGAGSLREIAVQLNAKGIQTARGCEWSPTAVMRVLAQR